MSRFLPEKKQTEKKKPNVKLYLLFALEIIIIFGLYRVVLSMVDAGLIRPLWFTVLMWSYLVLASVAFIAVVILNRGFSGKPVTADQLPRSWNHIEKAEYMEEDARRRRIAKYVMIPCIAFISVFIFEIAELYYVPMLKEMFSKF